MHFRARLVVLATTFAASLAWPGLLAAQSSPDTGLKVEGAIADYQVKPGDTVNHHMIVSLGAGAPSPMDIQIDARGLGQGLDGAAMPLAPEEDTSPYSARDFIKSIDNTAFRLAPGASQDVNARMVVPSDVSTTRYADIYIHALPVKTESLDIILAAHVPVLLSIPETPVDDTARISSVDVVPVVSGRPIVVSGLVKNTGNHHFKTHTKISLLDGQGKQLASSDVPFAGSSIVPTFTRKFTAAFGFLNRVEGLPAGTYIAEVVESLPDGKVLDQRREPFKIAVDYRPFADIDPADLVVVNYNDEVPYPIDARQKADMELSFTGLGKVTGTVVLGKFRAEPSGTVPFAAKPVDGGTGKDGLKFVGVGVQGFTGGTGHLSVYYRDTEVVRYNPITFFLGLRVAEIWERIGGLSSLPGSQVVKGDIPVSVFNDNPVIGLGGEAAITRQVQSGIAMDTLIMIAGGVGGAAVLGTTVVMVIGGRRRARDEEEDTEHFEAGQDTE